MKILIVDDVGHFVMNTTTTLRAAGLDVDGIVANNGMRTVDGDTLSEEAELALVRNADVIFLDHNMPGLKGDALLEHWQKKGISFMGKRVVGSSASWQEYVEEHFDAGDLRIADRVKRFLGL